MIETSLNVKTYRYRLTGMTRLLAAQAANPDVRSEFIASKAEKLGKGEDETAHLPEESLDKKNLTVFLRDEGALCISDYVIKGFLKEALGAIKSQVGIANHASKVDNYVLIEGTGSNPEYLHITKRGQDMTEPDKVLERPLRAMTMQGPRVSVTASEMVGPGWEIEFDLTIMENAKTPKSCALTGEVIERALEYGAFKGLGQWRNAQNGRFTFKRIG